MVRPILIEITKDKSLDDVRLELIASLPFLQPKTWIVDRVLAGKTVTLSDRRVDSDTTYLTVLNEAERGDITLAASPRRNPLCRDRRAARVLARGERGGPTWLSCFRH